MGRLLQTARVVHQDLYRSSGLHRGLRSMAWTSHRELVVLPLRYDNIEVWSSPPRRAENFLVSTKQKLTTSFMLWCYSYTRAHTCGRGYSDHKGFLEHVDCNNLNCNIVSVFWWSMIEQVVPLGDFLSSRPMFLFLHRRDKDLPILLWVCPCTNLWDFILGLSSDFKLASYDFGVVSHGYPLFQWGFP